jgi:hypothetical protein
MSQRRSRRLSGALLAVATLAAASCSSDGATPTSGPPSTAIPQTVSASSMDVAGATVTAESDEAVQTYTTRAFSVPFEVAVPTSLTATAGVDQDRFVSWEGTDPAGPAVRFMAPLSVYVPGNAGASPVPADYIAYLLGQEDHGAHFADRTEMTVDGLPATLVTATADEPLDGSLGCQAAGLAAGDCYGLQPEFVLRLAELLPSSSTVLAWLRHSGSVDDENLPGEIASFEHMLGSVDFGTSSAPVDTEVAGADSSLDGVWTAEVTFAELAARSTTTTGER